MVFSSTKLKYQQTGYYSKIVKDYLDEAAAIKPFFAVAANLNGLKEAIHEREKFLNNREGLVEGLLKQYEGTEVCEAVKEHIELLRDAKTFTITTAHQPNIFTGPLYFIYKILHAVKLAAFCKENFPEYNFVPVYFMGSEDADLEELGHLFISGDKLTWNTRQQGAVGRMFVDENLLQLTENIEAQVGIHPFGLEITTLIKKFYKQGVTIQHATLGLVNALFGRYGLVVLIPDSAIFKNMAIDLFKDELLQSHSIQIVEKTAKALNDAGYKQQAHSRDINLFYLKDDVRARIERHGDYWHITGTDVKFTKQTMMDELHNHPERFSPNVILRGLFQEIVLPNIAFIGGGGELAYWLQLKGIFDFYNVPYPVLVLRNSFLLINKTQHERLHKLGLTAAQLFLSLNELQTVWIKKESGNNIDVLAAQDSILKIYKDLQLQAIAIDATLLQHIDALKHQSLLRIEALGKKMVRAEKRNLADAMRQIEKVKNLLFPHGNLQERVDNFIPYYAKWGSAFIEMLYKNSLAIEQEFVVLEEA